MPPYNTALMTHDQDAHYGQQGLRYLTLHWDRNDYIASVTRATKVNKEGQQKAR